MHSGTISDLETHDRFGLIDADDGRILPFSRADIEPPLCAVHIGVRVEFMDASCGEQARAVAIRVPSRQI
jgi:hypothetical protein